jgi:NNP family nitrate/nitrite transporter-like MFS transporter
MMTSALVPGASRLCMPVLFKQIADDLGLSLVSIGAVWGMDPLAGVFINLPGGLLADRFGIKRTMAVVCILAGLFGAMRGLSGDFLFLAVTMFLFGLLNSTVPIIAAKATGVWFKGKRLGLANAFLNVSWSLGAMTATMFSATVFSPWLGGWRNVIYMWGVPCFVLGLLWLFTRRGPPKNGFPDTAAVDIPFRQALSHVARVNGVWIMGLLMITFFGATQGFLGYLPTYLRDIGWTPTAADSSITVFTGLGMLGIVPMTLLSDRLGSRKSLVALSLIALTAILVLIPLLDSTGVWVALIVGGLLRGAGPTLMIIMVIEMKDVGGKYGGTAMGLASSIGMIGAFFAPPLGNSFASPGAEGMPMFFWAGLSFLGLIPLLLIKSRLDTDSSSLRSSA